MTLPDDPLHGIGIAEYARRLRAGETTIAATVEAYLGRIARLDPRLGAYEHVAAGGARATAAALDALLQAGTDLGPLMGVPVGVKDLLAVDGMPTHAGTRLDVADMIGAEGGFVRLLRQAGCVILGKTKTVEFAIGAAGTNTVRGTPWNPWDAETQRIPGGSSSGSGVAVAAGLCAFAIGTDTGGSVRIPAAFNGIFGLKTTHGLWPLDGIFPLSPTLDTVGLLTRDAADAAQVFATLTGRPVAAPARLKALRLGRPVPYFYDQLDPVVGQVTQTALTRLEAAGGTIAPVSIPEAAERETLFGILLPTELIAGLGRERFEEGRPGIDPVIAARAGRGLETPGDIYVRARIRQRELAAIAARRMAGFDAWVTPASPLLPVPVAEMPDVESGLRMAFAVTRCSQPINLFGQCAVSLPVHHLGAPLPAGLQIVGPPMDEDRLLSIALAVEGLLGTGRSPDLSAFA